MTKPSRSQLRIAREAAPLTESVALKRNAKAKRLRSSSVLSYSSSFSRFVASNTTATRNAMADQTGAASE